MTAPTETPESVEQALARDETMRHAFCPHCQGEGPKEKARALCGTAARKLGYRGHRQGDECVVCMDLWYSEPRQPCSVCGTVPQ